MLASLSPEVFSAAAPEDSSEFVPVLLLKSGGPSKASEPIFVARVIHIKARNQQSCHTRIYQD